MSKNEGHMKNKELSANIFIHYGTLNFKLTVISVV